VVAEAEKRSDLCLIAIKKARNSGLFCFAYLFSKALLERLILLSKAPG
jgi:hypothetical protein